MFFLRAQGPAVSVGFTVVFVFHSFERFDSLDLYRASRCSPNFFHSAMLMALEFFGFFVLLLAVRQLSGVRWDYLLVLLRQLAPLLVMSRFELRATCVVFSPRLNDPDVASTPLLTEGFREVPFSCLFVQTAIMLMTTLPPVSQ